MGKDAELKAAINAEVKRAKEAGLASVNKSDLAAALHAKFWHRSVEGIQEMITDAWRNQGMVWDG